MDILKLITSQMGDGAIAKLSEITGESKENTSRAVQVAVPTLLNALNNNSNETNGASGILSALDRDHDGSILDDVMGFVGNTDGTEGNGIVKHILGDKKVAVEEGLSRSSGVSTSSMSKILAVLAPIIMGYLGRQKKQSGIKSSGGISDLLSSVVGSLGNGGTGGLDIGDILGRLNGAGATQQQSGSSILGTLGKMFGR